MLTDKWVLIGLTISALLSFILFINISKKKTKTQIQKICLIVISELILWCSLLIAQIMCSKPFNIEPIFFEYFVYIFITTIPIGIFLMGLSFKQTKLDITKKYLLLFLIPIITLLILWTNSSHHLFYEQYSVNIKDTITGPYVIVHYIYSYSILIIGIYCLLSASIKISGFFSKQTFLIIIGTLIPIIVNAVFTFDLFNLNATIYITPISFAIGICLYSLAIVKFKFLNIVPIALGKVVNRISDGFIVVNEEMVIIDYNETLVHKFNIENKLIRNKSLEELIETSIDESKKILVPVMNAIKETKTNTDTITIKSSYFKKIDKYFNIEVNSLSSKNSYIGSLILFKDITEHIKDQEIIVSKDQLSTLGEIAGGFAHDLNSPLRSIAGDIYNLKIYFNSGDIEIKDNIKQDVEEIFPTLDKNINNMSKMISTFKNQMADTNKEKGYFNLLNVVEGVKILLGSSLRKNKCVLNVEVDKTISIYGEDNQLSRTITNLVKNSIEAYSTNNMYGEINIKANLTENKDKCIIIVEDYAGGISKEIANTMFKEKKTTKKDSGGTGIGLYSTYRLIVGDFKGKMSFETIKKKENVGTRFIIEIPVK
ncbi:MAG: histidine kinase N-terminal 7TM domain-containing protein [Clostridia bacterium]|nr:histidine kinase N-terminal 7TM domain-containing protein [Clostridia bacterium]